MHNSAYLFTDLHTGDVQATDLLFGGAGTCHIPSNNKFNGQYMALLHNGHVWIWCAEQRILGDMSCVLHPPGTSLIEYLTLQVDAQPSNRNPIEWFCVSQTFRYTENTVCHHANIWRCHSLQMLH